MRIVAVGPHHRRHVVRGDPQAGQHHLNPHNTVGLQTGPHMGRHFCVNNFYLHMYVFITCAASTFASSGLCFQVTDWKLLLGGGTGKFGMVTL